MSEPSILGALAVVCYALCLLLHPWAHTFRAGWKFAQAWPWTWVTLGLVAAHQAWWLERRESLVWMWPKDFSPAFASELTSSVAVQAGNSVAATLVLPITAEPLSCVLAVALCLNLGGMSTALHRGCRTAFPHHGSWVWIGLLLSAVANVVWLAGMIGGWLPEHHWGLVSLHATGLLWGGATVAFSLAWLVRLAETHLRAPEEILQIQWPASAAGRIPRLWPIVIGAALAQAWSEWGHGATGWAGWSMRGIGWLLAAAAAFLPLLLVHWRGDWTWQAAFLAAGKRWRTHWSRFLMWLAVAYTHFFLLHLAHHGIASGLPIANALRLGWDSICALLHAALLVWLLVAWIAQQPSFQATDHDTEGK